MNRSPAARYGFALAATALALLITLALEPLLTWTIAIFFVAAVALSAWAGGLGPGILAAVLGVAAINFLLLPPRFTLVLSSPGDLLSLSIFLLVAVVISSLSLNLREARGRAEEALETYRVTLASIGDAVIATDAQGRVQFLNPVAAELIGWPAGEALGRPLPEVFRIVNEESRQPVENPVERAIREGVIVGLANHTVLIDREGSERPIDDSGAPIRTPDGRIIGAVLVFRDITERRRAEAELRRSRNQLDAILRAVADGITVQNRDGQLIYTNDVAARLVGYPSRDELLAAPVSEIMQRFALLDEDGRPVPLDRLPGRLVLQGAPSSEAVLRFRELATGEDRWAIVSAAPILNERGEPELAVNAFRDVTERMRAEQARRFLDEAGTLLNSSLDYEDTLAGLARLVVPDQADWCAVDMIEPDGTVHRLAVAHQDPTRVELARELRERYPPDPNADQGVPRVLREGRPELLPEIPDELLAATAQDAEHLRLMRELGLRSALILPLIARGQTLGALTMVWSESGRRFGDQDLALGQELAHRAALAIDNARLYRQAREAIEQRDEFLSVASHELKTPLATVQAQAQLLLRRMRREAVLEPERARRSAEAISRQAGKLARLIDQLLDVSRIEVGRLSIEPRPADLAALVREAAGAAEARAEDREIQVAAPPELPIQVDALRIEQVLANLLDNALKYSPPHTPIQIEVDSTSNGLVEVGVRDFGSGIPPEQRATVFERFHRAHADEYTSGMGLGLYISRQIVELHGGELTVEFPPDGGSRFIIRLPKVPGERPGR